MAINESIFKSYDVRGIYPAELNGKAAYVIGRIFARRLNGKTAVIGRDMRLGGEKLKEEFIRGVTDEGIDVFDLGLISIDVMYFAVGILGYPGGAMVTASHNPKEYNGFKMALGDVVMLRGEEIKKEALSFNEPPTPIKGLVRTLDVWDKFIDHVLSFCDPEKIKPLRVVVDAGNGMAGKVIPLLAKRLPIKVIELNFDLDGNFPAHPSNPLVPESQIQITQEVIKQSADLGVIFDGDTDRLFFVDEKGVFVKADYTLLVLAKEFLRREPGRAVVFNAICSKIVPEMIKQWGGVPVKSKVGFVNVTTAMRESGGIMGGELSAHYSFRDNAYADSGFIAFLIILQLISTDGRSFSEIVSPFYKYSKSPEINIELDDRDKAREIIGRLKEKYAAGRQNELDGLTVEYDDWWFNVRPSNTEPLLRVTIEADSSALLDERQAELIDFINNN